MIALCGLRICRTFVWSWKSQERVRDKLNDKIIKLYSILRIYKSISLIFDFLDFSSVLPEVEKAINEADFLCVDTEFSGINICSQNIRNIHDANFKYSSLKETMK